MTARTIVFLRHGRTAWNASARLQGQTDVPLDDVGRWQADLGARFLAVRQRAKLVISSDLTRAAQTAQAYVDVVGAPLVLDARLRERSFGQWEGLTRPELEAGWPEQYRAWRRGEDPHGVGAEPKAAVATRLLDAVEDHATGLATSDTLVVVSHGAAITLAIAAMLGQDPATWRGVSGLYNVHWAQVVRGHEGATPGWRLLAHNVGPDYPIPQWDVGPDAGADSEGDDADWISGASSA